MQIQQPQAMPQVPATQAMQLPLVPQAVTGLGIDASQIMTFGKGTQSTAQEYANTVFTSAMPSIHASDAD